MLISTRRNDWGLYDKKYDPSNLLVTPVIKQHGFIIKYDNPTRNYKSIDEIQPIAMEGNGFIDTLKAKLQKIPKYVSNASDLYSSDVGTAIRNLIPSSDENARPGFAGEKHAILQLPNGKNGVANYMGPGTNIIARLKRGDHGDPGRTKSDMASKRHDIDYALSKNEKTKDAQLQKVREADNRMIKSLQKIRENRSDSNRNIQLGMRLIQAKTIGEDLGMLSKSKFVGDIGTVPKDDLVLLEKERNKLQQSGYGDNGKLLPGQKLKMALLKNKLTGPKKPRTNPSMDSYLAGSGAGSYPSASKGLVGQKKGHILRGKPIEGKGMTLAGNGKKKTLCSGKGLKLAGKGIDMGLIMKELKNTILPKLDDVIGVKLPIQEVTSIVDKYFKSVKTLQDLQSSTKNMVTELIPKLMMYKLKKVKLDPVKLQKEGILKEAMKGKGLKLAGKGMYGSGIMETIASFMGKAKDSAEQGLGSILWTMIKSLALSGEAGQTYKNMSAKRPMYGKGVRLAGGDFWSEFANGFKTGFVKTLEILTLPIMAIAPELIPAVEIGKELGKLLPGKMLI
jgi:hypothetical protein